MTNKAKCLVRFEPGGTTIIVDAGTSLSEAARASGVRLPMACGGAGTCGSCNVLIKDGLTEDSGPNIINPADYTLGIRQACQSRILTDLVVDVSSALPQEPVHLAQESTSSLTDNAEMTASDWPFAPIVNKVYVELTPPSPSDNSSDLERLLNGLKPLCNSQPIEASLEVIRQMGATLRASNWQVTATLLSGREESKLINLEAGNTKASNLSLAFDIGTTAVRAQLLDLARGEVLAKAVDYNGQISYGADVISRIIHCQKPEGLIALQQAVVGTLNKLIRGMFDEIEANIGHLNHVMISANTVMVHLLLAINPQPLRLSPYVPTVKEVSPVKGCAIGLDVPEHVWTNFIPSAASYVGGDVVSGLIGTGICQRDQITLYIDIGTNGEIAAGNRDWLVTAAASAGPTFEGGGIKCGMIAEDGAIEDFELTDKRAEPTITIIGTGKAKGICGAGLINIAAAMLRTRLIDNGGKFDPHLKTPRLRVGPDGQEYVLAWGDKSQTGRDIVITEIDLNNLIRAKAALFASCQTIIKSVGNDFETIDQVVIAGTFGNHLNIENAITIGLLPDLPREKFIFTGNSSLLGARLCSFSYPLFQDAGRVAHLMTNLELSENPDFMANYVAAMFMPHTNMHELFPSVRLGASL